MLVKIIEFSIGVLLISIVGYVLLEIIRSYKRRQFFKLKSPNIPLLPNSRLFVGHALKIFYGDWNLNFIDENHKKYGIMFGFFYRNKPVVSTLDLDLIKTMTLDEPYDHVNRLPLGPPFDVFDVDSIQIAQDDQWRRLRKAIAPAFTNHKIKMPNVQADFKEMIDNFAESIEGRLERAKDMRGEKFIIEDADDIFLRYMLTVVFRCFYKQDGIINLHADKDYWVETLDKSLRSSNHIFLKMCIMFPILKPVVEWMVLHFHPQGIMRRNIMNFIEKQTQLNLKARKHVSETMRHDKAGNFDMDNFVFNDGTKFKRNMIDYVIDQYHDGKITYSEYFNSTNFIFYAAFAPTLEAISRLVYHLACHPDIQNKLRDSILAEGIESEYLEWTINESIRLFPGGLIGCSRIITRDIQTKAGLIPAGTFVLTPPYTIHRLTEYWGADSNEFRPERWSNAKNFHPCQYIAFGSGKRNCPGEKFALQNIKMLFDVILRRFKFEKCTKTAESKVFQAPGLVFAVFEKPNYVKISHIDE